MGSRNILIDSSVIIEHLRVPKHSRRSVFEDALDACDLIHISAISIYEIEAGARVAGRNSDFESFLAYLQILDVSEREAKEGAAIFAELKPRNKLISNRDILIAATARVRGLPVLTHNLAHFKRVPGIHADNSVKSLF